jgi:hypothetical protein
MTEEEVIWLEVEREYVDEVGFIHALLTDGKFPWYDIKITETVPEGHAAPPKNTSNFERKREIGEIQEQFVARYHTGRVATIEVKTEVDVWETTGNIFLEICDSNEEKTPSGIYESTADWISFTFVDNETKKLRGMVGVPLVAFRDWVDSMNFRIFSHGGDSKEGKDGYLIPMPALINFIKHKPNVKKGHRV